ncbi:MAG: PDZ domain-containing protein [Myxococcales bacterium]|nr:PDZ domain-containing protein [Myxococcales bacterium]MCB9566989.1 PDZ domain-containing protein [Myxococcales bacterium]MCB9570371.1 PDZ domain-containing protein [Myxococcales bacterium]MCB9704725.1 PDZ domain-containing protein [Myxococcales bacterium]
MKRLLSALGLVSLLGGAASSMISCDGGGSTPPTIAVTSEDLAEGGAYVVYINKSGNCSKGCDQLAKGDLILEVDGQKVTSSKDTRNSKIATGQPVKLKVWKKDTKSVVDVEVVAEPSDKLPPLKDAPPFWTISATDLDKAPQWARRAHFGHVAPSVMLVAADGGILSGRDLVGKKRFIVFWDIATREEQAQAADFLQVLQKAQADLNARGIDVMFAQIQFPSNTRQAAWNDSALRDFQKRNGIAELPPLPLFRFPNATEYNAAKETGCEGATSYIQYLRAPPAIVILDENGIIRWHSEGIQTPPSDTPEPLLNLPNQWTIIQAIEFALNNLQ